MMEESLAEKGKDCVAVARKALDEIEKGKSKNASVNLSSLQKDGIKLAGYAKSLAERLEKAREYNQKQEEEMQRKVGECGRQEAQLRSRMNSTQSTLDNQRRILQEKKNSLSQAQDDLNSAKRRLRNKQREANNIRIGAAVGGALLGAFTFGLGALGAGAVVGSLIGEAINELTKEVEKAERAVGRRRTDCSNAESQIRSSEQQISNIQSELSRLSSQKQQWERSRADFHGKATKLREASVYFQEATTVWLLFKQLSDHGTNRAALLKRIVEKAESKADPSILGSNTTKKVAGTVLGVWVEMESMMAEGRAQFAFSIEYQCTKCTGSCTDLPYLEQDKFICHTCNQRAIT